MLVAVIFRDPRRRLGPLIFVADLPEWEPRAACYVCSRQSMQGKKRSNCDRCGGSGYVGESRPPGEMLGWDVAWSDEGHVRLVGERTRRRRGEALYRRHACSA